MLVGISALTTIGLRRYYAEQADLPSPPTVCGGESRCAAYTRLLRRPGIAQVHAVFVGAAGCAVVAGVLALLLFRGAATRLERAEPLYAGDAWLRYVCGRGRRLRRPARGQPRLRRRPSTWRLRRHRPRRHRVVTCMDSRIDPLRMLGLSPATRRSSATPVAGSPPQALEALVLGVHLLNVDRILVIPHTRCAMASPPWRSCASGSASPPARTPLAAVRRRRRTSSAALEDDVRRCARTR